MNGRTRNRDISETLQTWLLILVIIKNINENEHEQIDNIIYNP